MGANLGVVNAFVIGLAFLQFATGARGAGARSRASAPSSAPATRTDIQPGDSLGTPHAATLSPCDAFGAARAVFIGQAGVPVVAPVTFADGLRTTLKLSPVTVERAFRGVAGETMYITPAGIETYLTPGERYLVYGRDYGFPNIVMSSDAYGTKLLRDATRDLEFLDTLDASAAGGTINGVLEVDESDAAHIGSDVRPLSQITMRLVSPTFTATASTSGNGEFVFYGVPPGVYRAEPLLPADLALNDMPSPTTALVSPGGCSALPVRAVPNGRVSGFVKGGYGVRALADRVALMPADLKADEPDRYFQSVFVDADGRFEFGHVRSGRYLLGRPAVTLNGEHIPATYYPDTAIRSEASVIVLGRSETVNVGQFVIARPREPVSPTRGPE
jgi:hypothetical protein